jgi:hypothetical protein
MKVNTMHRLLLALDDASSAHRDWNVSHACYDGIVIMSHEGDITRFTYRPYVRLLEIYNFWPVPIVTATFNTIQFESMAESLNGG